MTARRDGFALVEMMLALALLGSSLLVAVQGVVASQQANTSLQRQSQALDHALTILSRLDAMNFGVGGGAATADQIADLLSPVLAAPLSPTPATLTEIENAAPLVTQYNTGLDGTWQVLVNRDIDANGAIDGPLDGDPDLLRVQVVLDGRQVLHRVFGREPNE